MEDTLCIDFSVLLILPLGREQDRGLLMLERMCYYLLKPPSDRREVGILELVQKAHIFGLAYATADEVTE